MELQNVFKNEEKKTSDKVFIGNLRQIVATVCIGPISLGVALSWTSPVLPQLTNDKFTNYSDTKPLTLSDGSWVGSMVAIGVLLTAIPIGYLIGRYGAKICTLLLLIPMLVFTIMVIFLNDVYSLCAARFFSGVAAGGISIIGPMYISEISQTSFRGTLGSLFELLIYFGTVVVSVCGTYVDYVTLTIILGIINLALGFVFIYLPDTPTYLMKRKKRAKAAIALKFYRHNNYDVENDLDELHDRLHIQAKQQKKWKAIKSKAAVRGLVATIGLTMFQQLSGIDCIAFYLVHIFQATETSIDAYTSAIIVSFAQFVSAIAILFFIEKAGRKVFLQISATGMVICLIAVALYFQLKKNHIDFPGMNYIPIIGLVLHAFTFSIGLGPIPWIVNGEMFAAKIKGIANGVIMTVNMMCLFLVTKISPVVMDNYGVEYVFYFYAISMAVCVIFVKYLVIETRGKSLHAILNELNS